MTTKKYANMVFQHGSLDGVLETYLSDIAMLFLRKLPRHIHEEATIKHLKVSSGLTIQLEMPNLSVGFLLSPDRSEIKAEVTKSKDFTMKTSRDLGLNKTFSIGSDDNGVKLIAEILTYLGTF